MGGLSQLLETARRALMAQQMGISVTGHNIANASTPGYSRQRVELTASLPTPSKRGLLGTGVQVTGVSRLRNRFIDQQIRATNDALGKASTESAVLSQIQATLNEPSDAGISNAISQFFGAWQDLSTRPEETVGRNAVIQSAGQLAAIFNRVQEDVSGFRDSLLEDLRSKVDRINALSKEISDLSRQVTAGNVGGLSPNDARDQLDLRLDELSKLANIAVSEDERGGVMVSLEGSVIASSAGPTNLQVLTGTPATYGINSYDQVRIVTENGSLDLPIRSGELGAELESYNRTIPEFLGRLDTLARTIIDSVNSLHAAGYGRGTPASTGINFFSGTDAASMAVDLTDTSGGAPPGSSPDINNIAAALGPPPPAGGDNRLAVQIAALVGEDQVALGGVSIEQFFQGLVSGVASSINAAESFGTSQQMVLSQLEGQKEAVSGVSLDEEMTNLIIYQRAFDAAARVVATTDEMMQTILNMVA